MNSLLAYMIMPVGSDGLFRSKRNIIESAAHRMGWDTLFPLDVVDYGAASTTLAEIMETMTASSLVIADLTLERPSCYYELGVAQALGRPTFLLAAVGTVIHQAANREEVHFYTGMRQLSTQIEAVLRHSRPD